MSYTKHAFRWFEKSCFLIYIEQPRGCYAAFALVNKPGPVTWDDGHEQRISNGGRFQPAFFERDKKQTMTMKISEEFQQTVLKTSYVPAQGFLGYGLWEAIYFMYRRPTLYPLEIAVDFLKSP